MVQKIVEPLSQRYVKSKFPLKIYVAIFPKRFLKCFYFVGNQSPQQRQPVQLQLLLVEWQEFQLMLKPRHPRCGNLSNFLLKIHCTILILTGKLVD